MKREESDERSFEESAGRVDEHVHEADQEVHGGDGRILQDALA